MPIGTLTLTGIAAIVLLLALSAFFSSSETAIFSLPVAWIEDVAATGDPQGARLKSLRDDPHRLLVTILVGNNVVNVAISSIVTVLMATYFRPGVAVVAATVTVSVVILIFGEIVPKSVGLGNANTWALTVARPIRLVERALSPIVTVMDLITRRISHWFVGEVRIEEHVLD